MSRYQCSCGFISETTPRFGDTIVSVIHLHRAARVDGSSGIVHMEEIADPFSGCQVPGKARGERPCVKDS
jgi:hypothetical protein